MTVQLTPDLERQLQGLAAQTERTADQVAQDVLVEYLHFAETLGREISDAEAEANRDGWLTTEQAFARAGLDVNEAA